MKLSAVVLLGLIFFALPAHGVSPLYFHTHAIARIEARIEKIGTVQVDRKYSGELLSRKAPETVNLPVYIQKISLKVLKIYEYWRKSSNVPLIRKGQIVNVINPYVDQVPSFKAGDILKTRIRLVLPLEEYDFKDPRRQWWFYPKGTTEDIFPPRHPFRE